MTYRKSAGLSPMDGFLHPSLLEDEDQLRLGKLQVRFGVLGGLMALVYSAFFFALEHHWGGGIVAASGLIIMQVPWIVRRTGNLALTGHVYGAMLVLSFAALSAVGGGLQGFASAWLAAVPVCALLLMNLRAALTWSVVCFVTVIALAAIDMGGKGFLTAPNPEHIAAIEAASRIGLVVFLAFLGLLFEQARIEAYQRMKRAGEKLAEANEELQDLNRQKNEFLNIAAHDLKNPLGIICGYADLLKELKSPTLQQIRDQASEILRSGQHMLDIIRNILDVRAIEDGQRQLSKTRCSVQGIIENLLNDYRAAADAKQINLVYNIGTHPPEAWADPGACTQVLDNLISNAVKYTPHGGTITVQLSRSGEQLVVEVSDDGPGLSAGDQQQLWGKFVRLSPRPTGNETSNGLGLWIARRLAREMDGDTFCRSIAGSGSTFGIRLPLWTGQEDVLRPEPDGAEDDFAPGSLEAALEKVGRARERGLGPVVARNGATSSDTEDEPSVALPS